MEVEQVLQMNKGEGESSYAKNSTVQRNIISIAHSIIGEALQDLLRKNFPESMGIADLGCSSGPNTLAVASEIIDIVYATSRLLGRTMPEMRISLNDLPGNDFNGIFVSLPAFYNKLNAEKGNYLESCFVSGMPGTFYGRLFPRKSQHFIHSSSSLHWLSQVPPALDINASKPLNKGKIYVSKTSPASVLTAYLSQFQQDFSMFLKSRAEEVVPGGRMVLSFMGRCSSDAASEESCHQWELLARALMSMASEGLIEEEKIDSFNAPYYAPSCEEVKNEIEREGSFTINGMEAFEVEWDAGDPRTLTHGQRVSKTIRAVIESMLESHFGRDIMDEFFARFTGLVDEYYSISDRHHYIDLVISLTRKVLVVKEEMKKAD